MVLTKTVRGMLAVAMMLLLAACASKSYVVLLDNGDGTVGKVVVVGRDGSTLLDQPRQGTQIGGSAGEIFAVNEAKVRQDFGAAMVASPVKPVSFLLYFEAGGAKLTAESEADIPRILAEIGRRVAPDISVIGHTDTAGDAAANEALGLSRAEFVAGLMADANLEAEKLSVESHGEKNLLVPTPDSTAEPRNRRVEVTVR